MAAGSDFKVSHRSSLAPPNSSPQRTGHVERAFAMIFKTVGLKPHGWLNRIAASITHRLIVARVRRCDLREIKIAAASA